MTKIYTNPYLAYDPHYHPYEPPHPPMDDDEAWERHNPRLAEELENDRISHSRCHVNDESEIYDDVAMYEQHGIPLRRRVRRYSLREYGNIEPEDREIVLHRGAEEYVVDVPRRFRRYSV